MTSNLSQGHTIQLLRLGRSEQES